MMLIFNTFFLFILSIFFYLSILGFGIIYYKEEKLSTEFDYYYFIIFFYGITILTIIGFLEYILNINSQYLNLFTILIGVFFFFNSRSLIFLKKKIIEIILILFTIFPGIIISKLHEDWAGYHFPFIDQISNYRPILGLSKIDMHLAYASFLSYFQKKFFLPYYDFKLINIPIFLIFFNIILFLIKTCSNIKKQFVVIFFLILITLLLKFTRFSEFGYDAPTNIILLSIFIIYCFEKNQRNFFRINYSLYFLLFVLSVTFKANAIFFLPIFIIISYNKIREKSHKFIDSYKNIFLIIALSSCFFLDNLIRSGCFFYFLKESCFDNDIIPWAINESQISNFSIYAELWAKGFYHQKELITQDPNLYLNIKIWLSNWYKIHFHYHVIEFILIPFTLFLLLFFLLKKTNKDNIVDFNKIKIYLLLSSITSIFFWLNTLPDIRFAKAIIVIFFCCIINFFIQKKNFTYLNFIKSLIIISLFLYSGKNIKRIYDEFKRNDNHKFVNYPFPPQNRIKYEKDSINKIKFTINNDYLVEKYGWFYMIK